MQKLVWSRREPMLVLRWIALACSALATPCLAAGNNSFIPDDASLAPAPPKKTADNAEIITAITPGFRLSPVVDGSFALENPSGRIRTFGNLADDDGRLSGDVDNTSPDQNVYLRLETNPGGPTKDYDYGRHFLFQGHEIGGGMGYVTRINLDVIDPRHKITLITPVDPLSGKTDLHKLDGSAYNPFTRKLMYTEERGDDKNQNGAGRVIEISPQWPPKVEILDAQFGLGGYEGVHVDQTGAVYLIEDVKGRPSQNHTARIGDQDIVLDKALQPNSFVYRFLPTHPDRLQDGGKMQAIQVYIDGSPLTFNANDPDSDLIAIAQKKLYTQGSSWPFKWVTIKEAPAGSYLPYNATQAAKNAGATPFKRPENMAWLPGSDFHTFFFSVTGDTQIAPGMVPELAARGAWGGIFRVDQQNARRDGYDGDLSLFVLGDAEHTGFDNLTFVDESNLLVAEDRNDVLHDQLKLYDSVWMYNLKTRACKRFIALGVDRYCCGIKSADNEPTGLTVSNGSTEVKDMIGTQESLMIPRAFITQEHGKNRVFEIMRE